MEEQRGALGRQEDHDRRRGRRRPSRSGAAEAPGDEEGGEEPATEHDGGRPDPDRRRPLAAHSTLASRSGGRHPHPDGCWWDNAAAVYLPVAVARL
ncbi:hypothetical protein E2562_011480 [Oryza meyeriana var. granulata]|uniref:Uncharacterized protein n=1 Tax=Oryza meyeriana var. granulata TaxID=110450 RepID=A0A6G1D2C8_9ORYZ|nr:hypothetical protein E2562_011480 [Oryza meyeriana var. granulata]